MDSPYVINAAKEAVKNLRENEKNNVLAKAKAIRDYIYEKLTYVMDRYHEGTEEVLRSGEGSCGEYLNVFLSLFRFNNIPIDSELSPILVKKFEPKGIIPSMQIKAAIGNSASL